MAQPSSETGITLAMATDQDLDAIYRMRHEVYATELGQHAENENSRLTDSLDDFNSYIVAKADDSVAGFISITPPGGASYSVDKYFLREEVPVPFDEALYELRILTVAEPRRGGLIAPALMYSALRWIEERGGRNIVAIGRVELLDLYLKAGLQATGKRVRSGALMFELLTGTVADAVERLQRYDDMRHRVDERFDWQLDFSRYKLRAAYHGGASFDAIGRRFDDLSRIDRVISADVLDAWFPPSPTVLEALGERLDWAIRTSPPTGSEGLTACIAEARGVPEECVLPGAGSSSLIFLAMQKWLTSSSHALILDPAYGEYAHVLDNVIGCGVQRLPLDRKDGYRVNLERLETELSKGYDLCVIVNPNNPTGRHVPRAALEEMLSRIPDETTVWIDETYVDYVSAEESLEPFAAASRNVVVCKSMSKVYALSGLRVGYLCGPLRLIDPLRTATPPWAVSLPGQLAAVMALRDPDYYSCRYEETHGLRTELMASLMEIADFDIVPSIGNYLLCHLPEEGPTAQDVIAACRQHGLYLRNAGATSPVLGDRAVRIAVKDAATNERMIETISRVIVP